MWLPGVHAPPPLWDNGHNHPSHGPVFTISSPPPAERKHLAGMGASARPASGQVRGTRPKEATNAYRLQTLIREPTGTHEGHFRTGPQQHRSVATETAPHHGCQSSTGPLASIFGVKTLVEHTHQFELLPLRCPFGRANRPVSQTTQRLEGGDHVQGV